jgi:predicted phage gp36 major capsid-like protein
MSNDLLARSGVRRGRVRARSDLVGDPRHREQKFDRQVELGQLIEHEDECCKASRERDESDYCDAPAMSLSLRGMNRQAKVKSTLLPNCGRASQSHTSATAATSHRAGRNSMHSSRRGPSLPDA